MYEGISRALMESLALGLPAVETDVPGTRSLIQSGRTGSLVKYDDVPGFSGVLATVRV
jgi:glycosyltransferase involved in cell wall biosynthesis